MSELSVPRDEANGSGATSDQSSASLLVLFAALHVICCGLPLLLLSGVSIQFLLPTWPVAGGIMVVLGTVGVAWYAKRGCVSCPPSEGDARAMKT